MVYNIDIRPETIIHIYCGITCGRELYRDRELYAQRLQKLIYLYLLTGYFMKIALQSTDLKLCTFIITIFIFFPFVPFLIANGELHMARYMAHKQQRPCSCIEADDWSTVMKGAGGKQLIASLPRD